MLVLLVAVLVFAGECLAMLSEIIGAKDEVKDKRHIKKHFYKMAVIMTFAGFFALLGYSLGITVLKNIWIVSVVSIASELILEPFLDYKILKQLPTKGAAIGFVLGAVGIMAALLIP